MKHTSRTMLLCCALGALWPGLARAQEVRREYTPNAKAAALIELKTGNLLYGYHENTPLPMASTTKVMTALLAIENCAPDELVTAGHNAFGVPGTSIYLSEGESLRMADMLQGLMLASGNDAAVAIAEHVAGSVDSFAKMMTQRARELGCKSTIFLTPHGLPCQGHQTTAYELALIAREAMSHEAFRAIVSTQRSAIPWEGRSYDRILNNKNRLLSEYEGATGIKTGYTKAAGRCLVFGARRDGLELVGVVLGCPDWFEESKRLLDYGYEHFELFDAYYEGETVRYLPVADSRQAPVPVVVKGDLCAPVRKGLLPLIEIDLPDSLPEGTLRGDEVGLANLMVDGMIVGSTPLIVDADVPVNDMGSAMGDIFTQWITFP